MNPDTYTIVYDRYDIQTGYDFDNAETAAAFAKAKQIVEGYNVGLNDERRTYRVVRKSND